MQLAKFQSPQHGAGIAVSTDACTWRHVPAADHQPLQDWLADPDLVQRANDWSSQTTGQFIPAEWLVAPIDEQEVWAAGVTYRRSQAARMEESEAAASCYDRVYTSARPELFLKATPHRVVGPGGLIRIRRDAHWNVPEPELTLVINCRLEIVGYTIGNDVSSRDIEGENPLYLPQAKVYDGCCALGPAITLAPAMPPLAEVQIDLTVHRAGQVEYGGNTSIAQMARSPHELVEWLGRDNSFPAGAFLLTGTGIVPPREFTLQPADIVTIRIDGIGTLVNQVVQR